MSAGLCLISLQPGAYVPSRREPRELVQSIGPAQGGGGSPRRTDELRQRAARAPRVDVADDPLGVIRFPPPLRKGETVRLGAQSVGSDTATAVFSGIAGQSFHSRSSE